MMRGLGVLAMPVLVLLLLPATAAPRRKPVWWASLGVVLTAVVLTSGGATAADSELQASRLGTIFYVADVTGDGGSTLPQVFKVNGDGSGRVALTPPSRRAGPVVPSPDGRRVAYVIESVGGPTRKSASYMANADGRWRRQLPHSVRLWSPDSRSYAFASGRAPGLQVMGPGGRVRRLTRGAHDGAYAWSTDGRRIAFTRLGSIFSVDADGSGRPRKLTQLPSSDQSIAGPALSPDWTRLLFVNDNDELFMRDLRSGSSRKLRIEFAVEMQWSPDGRRFVFLGPAGSYSQLYLGNADGSRIRPIPGSQRFVPATWSTDGTRIAYTRVAEGVKKVEEGDPVVELWTMRTDGSDQRRIVPRATLGEITWTE